MFSRLPDRTFIFAVLSLLMSIAAFIYLVLGPAIEIVGTGEDGNAIVRRVSIGDPYGLTGIFWAVVPAVINLGAILSVPPSGKSERRHKFNLIFGTVLMWVFIGFFFSQLGLLYIPAATMLTSVMVLMFIRDRAWGKNEDKPRAKTAHELREEAVKRNRRSGNAVGRRRARRSARNR